MKRLIVLVFAMLAAVLGAQTHPRLFFNATDVPGYRSKASTAPWSDMLAAIEWNLERCLTTGYDSRIPSAHAMAALHLFRDSGPAPADWSEQAKLATLYLISAPDASGNPVWAVNGYKSLTRAGRGLRAAIAFDICHSAWSGQTIPATFVAGDGSTYSVPAPYAGMDLNAGVSLALKNNADSLVASGGSEWPGDTKEANNWFAVRYGAALLGYLACDEPEAAWSANYNTCLNKLRTHYSANLTTRADTGGWNPEGVAYAQYPGYFTFPTLYALKRIKGIDLTTEIPALNKTLWSTYQGLLAIDRYSRTTAPGDTRFGWSKGLRPDFTDDHNSWDPEGTAALAFAFSPDEFKPGLKWLFRRTCGDLGDQTWDTSSGNGLWSLLFYPNDLAEQNPAAVWGKTYQCPSYGVYVFRNRYQDTNDFVLQTHGNFRLNDGGHDGPDALSFRIYGLGVPWCVGSGRTTNPQGQTSIFPADPNTITSKTPRLVPSLVDKFLRANGDGYTVMNIDTSDTGVDNQTRRIVTDYSGASGAPGFFVVSDASNNGSHWRLNTPSFNNITHSGNTFTITSPDGHVMTAKVLWPPSPTFRTGTFNRPPSLRYKDVNYTAEGNAYSTINKWIDFAGSGDGRFVVAIAITENGAPIPTISATGTGDQQTVSAGTRTITLDGNEIAVNGWTRPDIAITSPTPNQQFNAGPTNVTVTGTVADPDSISRVAVSLDGVAAGDATLDGSGGFSLTLPNVPLGQHEIRADVFDGVNDQNSATTTFKINSTVPPEVAITWPGVGQTFQSGQTIVYQGTASDAENNLVRVELWENGVKLGNATLTGGNWTYTRGNVPTGRHNVYAEAIDGAGDFTRTPVLQVLASARFADTNAGDGALWLMANSTDSSAGSPDVNGTKRWAILEHDGDLRLRGRNLVSFDYNNHQVFLRDTSSLANWRLEYKFKIGDFALPNPESYIRFGTGDAGSVCLDLRKTNGLIAPHPDNQSGTRVWNPQSSGPRPSVAYSLNPATAPAAPGTDFAGIPNAAWNNVRINRVGRTMKVYVNDLLILDGDNGYLGTKGPVGFANERNTGSICWYDDVAITPLDAAGDPIVSLDLHPAITTPAQHADLAAGNVNFSGTAHVSAAAVDLYLGSTLAATVPVSGGNWNASLNLAAGQFAATAVARDGNGSSSNSPVRMFRVSATGGVGGNQLPVATLSQNNAVLPPNLGLTGSCSDADGSVSLVQVFRGGTLAGNATRSGNTWTYTFNNLPTGSYAFTVRVYDNLGDYTEASATIAHDGNQAPTISAIANQTIPQNTTSGPIAFTLGDDTTPVNDLTVTTGSSNTTLLPLSGITLGGSGANRSVTLAPATGQSGAVIVTITVTDGEGKSASRTFNLDVTAPPTPTAIVIAPVGAVITVGTNQQFSAVLNDQFGDPVVPQPTFTWSVSGGGTISVSGVFSAGNTPGNHQVTASAGAISSTIPFTVSVAAAANVIVSSGFEGYPSSGAVLGTSAPAVGDVGIASDTWAGANWSWQGSGLSYTDANGTIGGGSRALDYTGSNNQFRQVNVSPVAPIQQTVYIRFLGKIDSIPTTNRLSGLQFVINNNVSNNSNNFFPGFGILAGGPTVTNGTNANQFFAASNSSGITNAPTALFGGIMNSGVNLVVGRLVWNTGLSKFTTLDVWANPVAADHGTPDGSIDITSLNIASLSEIVIRGGASGSGPVGVVDELVIATGWSAVVPQPAAPSSGFVAWQESAFPEGTPAALREPDADFDLDGLVNLLEYGLGTDPATPSIMPPAHTVEQGGDRFLQISWTRPDDRSDIVTIGEVSPDLTTSSWLSSPTKVSTTITPAGSGMETVTVRLLDPIDSDERAFLRVRITL